MPIFDQGYQHWNGKLSGHSWRWLAIARHGVRNGLKGKILRLVLFLSMGPALALAGVLCLWGLLENKSKMVEPVLQFLTFANPQVVFEPREYRVQIWTLCFHYFMVTELRFSMVLVLLVGPSLISQDLRFNALPLYFSRPLRRIDYFLGKLGVVAFFLAMVTIVPSIIAYILGVLFSMDFAIVAQTYRLLIASIVYGAIIALSAGLLILALSSLSRNSRYVALFWIGLWLISGITAAVLQGVNREEQMRAYSRANSTTLTHPGDWRAQQRFWRQHRQDVVNLQIESSRYDWRPIVSYTEDLTRLDRALLGTDDAWKKLSELVPEEEQPRFFLDYVGPLYPWYWSALVLLGLFGLSACTLNFPVKSLDRLR